ncbi:MAG: hypothetical protein ACREL7_08950 [Longimicrobiales bacterium]
MIASPLDALEALLARNRIPHVRSSAQGPAAEIAVIEAPLSLAARLAELAPQIRALGFRYVTIDLAGDFEQ